MVGLTNMSSARQRLTSTAGGQMRNRDIEIMYGIPYILRVLFPKYLVDVHLGTWVCEGIVCPKLMKYNIYVLLHRPFPP